MVSRVLRERELVWVDTAREAFDAAGAELGDRDPALRERIDGLAELALVGAHLLRSILDGESVDTLPIKTVGELARAARKHKPE
jgi:hypothetical protein